ncbi:hypothetical protein CRE_09489 [Caenorhabditis remanei]|uniref:Uncharacterized protein n=1 Tax=Caenorhabditis remanei TaxID=31234 RepID=E3MJ47_CAERE|nr:hypothetical protein CRE_09489 [Caenorhabditis remanei]
MILPSLSGLAFAKVNSSIDILPLSSRPLGPVLSNKFFRSHCPIQSIPSKNLEEYILKVLTLTHANLMGTVMTDQIVPMFNSQRHLLSLSLGYFKKLEEYQKSCESRADYKMYKDNSRPGVERKASHRKEIRYVIDIGALLKNMISQDSRQTLTHLNLSPEPSGPADHGSDEQFSDGWAQQVGEMLPALTNLIIRQRILSPNEFQSITKSFPKLQKLDLTNTCLESLSGISNLKDLKTLHIGCLKIKSIKDFKDLFELTELRNLSFEATWTCLCCRFGNGIQMYLKSGRTLPNLETVDFSMNKIEEKVVHRFVTAHPSLKSVSICKTGIEKVAYPGVEVFHSNGLSGLVKSLRHYTKLENVNMVDAIVEGIYEELKKIERRRNFNPMPTISIIHLDRGPVPEEPEERVVQDFPARRHCMIALNAAVEKFGFLRRIMENSCGAYQLLLNLTPHENFPVADRMVLVDLMLNYVIWFLRRHPTSISGVEAPWKVLHWLIVSTIIQSMDRHGIANVAALALQTIPRTTPEDSRIPLEFFCMLRGYFNTKSDAFSVIDFPKLVEKLEVLVESGPPEDFDDWPWMVRAHAAEILYLVKTCLSI